MFVPQTPNPAPPAAAGGLLGRLASWRRHLARVGVALVVGALVGAIGWYAFWPVPEAGDVAEGYIAGSSADLSVALAELALPGDDRREELARRIYGDFRSGDVAYGCRTPEDERGGEVEVTCVVRIDVQRPVAVYMEAPLQVTVDLDEDAFRPSPRPTDAFLRRTGMVLEVRERR